MKNKSELLLPAGSLSKLKTAFLYGADAVYCGVPNMSLRATAGMTYDDVEEGIKIAHELGKKIYLALNLYTHNYDLENLPKYVETLNKLSPDGVIIADPGVFDFVKKHAPKIPLFISTQANVCSSLTLKFWENQGASLCVLGRETSFAEIAEIKKDAKIKIEMFIHGAMCMSYSGRCLLSNFLAGRSANQGKCAQSCRWKYELLARPKDEITHYDFALEEEMRKGDYMPIEEDGRGAYIMNSKDMCLLPKLPQILDAGIDSLKVEGRNKSEYYVGSVARIYRKAIDDWYADSQNWHAENYMQEFHTIQNRGYTYGFFDGDLTHHANNYDTTRSDGIYRNIGFVREYKNDCVIIELRNNIATGDVIELLSPNDFSPKKLMLNDIIDATNFEIIKSGKLSAGHEKSIAIPFDWFITQGICKNKSDLQNMFPVLTLARKLRTDLLPEDLEFFKNHSSSIDEMKLKM
ncbi:MAG: U32 family peptidase [Rickettsiales bacterium]|nr:U32 family peptidase [Rickettsiales bacterium]